ncbi:sulfurtransferase [Piscibacillus halophilus]|uniref:Thiosulfate/3-mercaptopyruvate sulfurtransferase n=1 Tax=Piscibacillus halophilus TaxID=571933 RepID=A0A1H8ZNI6_9BACI|nr:sulfurtransferase [Piscibacillus halophilus]SEP65877.1 thiosulfate/3-mercaptopyruvate sulfurtransferase [Piscibacillus halophilus]
MIISVEEAYKLYTEEDVIFADCRFNLQDSQWGMEQYQHRHIPNAVYFDLEKDLSGEVKSTGGRHPLPSLDTFTARLAERGINRDTTVVVYCQNRAFSSRMYWLLKFIGHPNVYLMNGGIQDWMETGYSVTKSNPIQSKSQYGDYQIQEHLVADMPYVKQHKEEERVVLIDSRSYERYLGKHEPIDHKAGHIPGAVNSDWTKILDENQLFKAKDNLKEYFMNYQDANEIIVYCGSGVTAAPNVVALWRAGFRNVRLYVGSFSDWISYEENEIETL